MTELGAYYLNAQVQVPQEGGSHYPEQAFIVGRNGVIRITQDGPVIRIERESAPTLIVIGLCVGLEGKKRGPGRPPKEDA